MLKYIWCADFYLKDRQVGRDLLSAASFFKYLQALGLARLKSEAEAPLGSQVTVVGTQWLEPSPVVSRVKMSRNQGLGAEPRLKLWHSWMGWRCSIWHKHLPQENNVKNVILNITECRYYLWYFHLYMQNCKHLSCLIYSQMVFWWRCLGQIRLRTM